MALGRRKAYRFDATPPPGSPDSDGFALSTAVNVSVYVPELSLEQLPGAPSVSSTAMKNALEVLWGRLNPDAGSGVLIPLGLPTW